MLALDNVPYVRGEMNDFGLESYRKDFRCTHMCSVLFVCSVVVGEVLILILNDLI